MPCRIHLFCEDVAQESWARAIVERVAREEEVEVTIRTVSAKLGIPRLKHELRAYSATARETAGLPDLLVVLVDANTVGRAARLEEVVGSVELGAFPHAAVGIPDPCIERWFLADPSSFAQRFSSPERPATPSDCESWKRELEAALLRAEEIVVGGGAEFADEIVEVMDFFRAGKESPTLKTFVEDVRGAIRQLGQSGGPADA
jgi:hypothetical protein